MTNKIKDEEILNILLHKSKTRSFLSRVKKVHPDKWLRIKGNILMATEELRDRKEQKTLFRIGIFDPTVDIRWSWHCHYHDGIYLSENKRPCKHAKAAQFDSAEQARLFFHTWNGNKKYKMELIESTEEV